MITLEKLKSFGADIETGLSRCLNKEDFYLKMVNMGLSDEHFDSLGSAIVAGDLDGAFENVHALKGVLGNLSLTPLYEKTCELTELLRNKTPGDYEGLYKEIIKMRDELLEK